MSTSNLGGGDLSVTGAEELEKVGHRLVEIGAGDLRKQLFKKIREAGKPLVADIRHSAAEELPHRGGLADLIAKSRMGVRTRISGDVSVRVVASSPHDIAAINAGKLRHPVFGTKAWVVQDVPQGWFTKPTEKREPAIRSAVIDAMRAIAEEATRRV